MFDIQQFVEHVCDQAYPKIKNDMENKWTYKVSDLLNIPLQHEIKEYLVVAVWRLAGIDRNSLDQPQDGINFEVSVSASSINALNAFHWSLLSMLSAYDVRLSDLIGDVEEDEPVSPTMRHNARAFRVWGLTVSQSVTGMNELFEEPKEV